MNDWFKGFQRFVFESFCSIKEITQDYLDFIVRSLIPSLWVIGVVVVLISLSEFTGYAIFNILGFLIASGLILFWVVLLQPFVELGVQLKKFPPAQRAFSIIGATILVLILVFIFSFKVSPGIDGASKIGLFLMLALGFWLVGIKVCKKQLGYNLIVFSFGFALLSYFPLTSSYFSVFIEWIDRTISTKLVPSSDEYEFSLEKFNRYDSDEDRLFLKGDPRKWCREDEDRIWGYKCFNQPGYDQVTNEKLIPISEEIVKKIKLRLIEANAQAEALLAAEQSAAAQKAEQEHINQIEEEKSAYIKKYVLAGSNKADMATSFSNGATLDSELSHLLRIGFKKPMKSEFLNQQALKDGVFDRLFQGDKSEFEKLELAGLANKIMLGEIKQTTSGNKAIAGVIDATILIEVRLLNTLTGEIINSSQINGSSAGYSESEAISKARSKAVKAIIEQFEL